MTPSPPNRILNDDVKSEPIELVCGTNPHHDEHSNDSVGDAEMNHADGKGSLGYLFKKKYFFL